MRISALQVVEQFPPLRDEQKKTTARTMVLLVGLEVLGKLRNASRQQRHLDFRRTNIFFVACICGHNFLFRFYCQCHCKGGTPLRSLINLLFAFQVSINAIVMENRRFVLLAVFMGGWLLSAALPVRTVLENSRVRTIETTYLPGVPREPGVRATDQVIVFLDDCTYQRKDPVTGELTIRKRKRGEVLWHDKGEAAPQLINKGDAPYRTLTIELR